jgi:hypothetical protein
LTDSNKIKISKIPTDLDSAGQNKFFNVRKTYIKNLDALLKIAQSLHFFTVSLFDCVSKL